MFIRGRYGHGGRVGYDREWRADPAKSGGGELIDQGVHLIDLAGWFLGSFTERPRRRDDLLLGHAGRRQRVHDAANRDRADGLPARELHRVEEPVLARDLRPRRQDRDRRPGRQLRRRAAGATIGCCRRWDRPRRPFTSIPAATARGRSSSPSSSTTSASAASLPPVSSAARAALVGGRTGLRAVGL